MVNLASFWKTETCGQTVLPERSVLIGQKLVETAKIKIIKCDILSNFQTMWCCQFLHWIAKRSFLFSNEFSTIIRSKFGSQMSVSCSSDGRSQGRGDSSIGMSHETILNYSRCKISGQGMGVAVGVSIGVGVVGGGHGHCDQASENLKFTIILKLYFLQKLFYLPKASSWLLRSFWRTVKGKMEGRTFLYLQFRASKQPQRICSPTHYSKTPYFVQ